MSRKKTLAKDINFCKGLPDTIFPKGPQAAELAPTYFDSPKAKMGMKIIDRKIKPRINPVPFPKF